MMPWLPSAQFHWNKGWLYLAFFWYGATSLLGRVGTEKGGHHVSVVITFSYQLLTLLITFNYIYITLHSLYYIPTASLFVSMW